MKLHSRTQGVMVYMSCMDGAIIALIGETPNNISLGTLVVANPGIQMVLAMMCRMVEKIPVIVRGG